MACCGRQGWSGTRVLGINRGTRHSTFSGGAHWSKPSAHIIQAQIWGALPGNELHSRQQDYSLQGKKADEASPAHVPKAKTRGWPYRRLKFQPKFPLLYYYRPRYTKEAIKKRDTRDESRILNTLSPPSSLTQVGHWTQAPLARPRPKTTP